MTVLFPSSTDLRQALELLERAGITGADARSTLGAATTIAPTMPYRDWLRSLKGRSRESLAAEYGSEAVRAVLVLAAAAGSTFEPEPALELYGRPVLAVRTITDGRRAGQGACMLAGPKPGEVCSLPEGHQPADVHEVQVLAYATITRFTSDTENTMNPSEQEKRDAGKKRAKLTNDVAAKPLRPRTTPTPRDVRPQAKPDER